MKTLTISLISALFVPALGFAQTSETKATAETGSLSSDLKDAVGQKKFEDTHEITDAKLRAEGGSLSRYSAKVNFTYYGPILSDPGAKDQPNPDGSIGVRATSFKSSLSARYRLDPSTTISMGTGLNALHPFHGMDRTDVNNPYVSYDYSTRWNGIQMRHSPGYSIITVPDYKKVGEYGSPNYYFNMVYDLGTSGFATALDANIQYFLYDRAYVSSDGKAGRYNISFTPNLKYNINDRMNVSTSLNLSYWNARSNQNEWAIWPNTPSQSLGFGYAYARDIYLSPYINFYPDKLSADRTTFNFSTIFSVL